LSQSAELLLLFVVAPFFVAGIVIAIVVSRAETVPPELRTSALLENGEPARAELVDWRNRAMFFLDRRPMVAFRLSVHGSGEPFELVVVQSVTRQVLSGLSRGMDVDVRLSADRTAGAIDFHS